MATDGSAEVRQQKAAAGYGVVFLTSIGKSSRQVPLGDDLCTNQRAELRALTDNIDQIAENVALLIVLDSEWCERGTQEKQDRNAHQDLFDIWDQKIAKRTANTHASSLQSCRSARGPNE